VETLDPATEDLSPGWLEGMLAKRFRDARVSRVEIETSSEGTNANAQLRVTYAAPTDAPSHIFVKLPPRNPQQRELVLGSGMGRREVLFYRHLAPHVPMRVPQVYATGFDEGDGTFAILIEDLEASKCRIPDGETGVGRRLAERAMEDFAALHQAGVRADTLDLSIVEPPLRQPLYAARMLEHALATRADRMGAGFSAIARLYIDHGEAVHDLWEFGDAVLTHGDGHLMNLFIDDGRLGFFDWGCFALAPAMRDVGYFLCMALSVADRRAHERDLIRHYLEHRHRLGAPVLSFDAAWAAHRLQASYAVIAAAPALLNPAIGGDPNGLYAGHFVSRASAAVEDLGAADTLRAELGL
jgi:aminoglycoside phosphotransferase (APT) family kinase protein